MKLSITPIAGMAAIVCLMAEITVPRAGAMPPVSAHPLYGSAPDAGTPVALANGKVVETMNSGGYTYVLVDDGSKQLWAAAPKFTVAVGDLVKLPFGSPMANFHSKTLDRTFELVHFVPSVEVLGQPAAANVAPTDVKVSGIEKADDGYTVGELFAGKDDLEGKEVSVRGKVVKYNGGILGRNWLHVQDGTGAAGTNDLTITTDAEAAVGDTVLVRGTLGTDKKFGSGYEYAVIIEGATVTKE